jgi:CHAD domain-containing protein
VFRLLSGYMQQPCKRDVPKFEKNDSLSGVLQALIWSCLHHLQGNLQGAMASADAEYLHQMRVALRRLRVVLRMAEKIRPDVGLAALRGELALLGSTLGRIREWDVFIAGVAEPLCALREGDEGLQMLLNLSQRQRAEHYATLQSDDRRRELQRFMLRLAIWMNGWQQEGEPRVFAGRYLRRLEKRYKQAQQQPDAKDSGQLHALRILAKKLRYSAECYASLYGKKAADKYLSALAEVQEILGKINDAAVAHRLLDELAKTPELSAHSQTPTLARDWIEDGNALNISLLHKTARRFDSMQAYWRS